VFLRGDFWVPVRRSDRDFTPNPIDLPMSSAPSDPPSPSPAPAPAAPAASAKQENALANLLLNVVLPVTILSYCGKETGPFAVGPKWALVIAMALPLGYQAWDWHQRRKMNIFSILGMVGVLLTGGLGLLELSARAFALKEAAIPLLLAVLFVWTHRSGKPLVKALLMNPDLVHVGKIERLVRERQQEPAFQQILWQSTWTLAGSFVLSAVLNYGVAMHFLAGQVPGSEAYTAALGKITGWGFVITGLPMMAFLVLAFLRLLKRLQQLTGLSRDDLMVG
jgi:hypothetical protein